MTRQFYTPALTALGEGNIAWDTGDFRVIAVDAADYTFDASHEFLSSVPAGARVAVTGSLTTTAGASGVFDASDTQWTSVTGDVFEALILYCHDGGADNARRLIAYDDEAVNLPYTPSGADISLSFGNSAARVFRIRNAA